EPAAGHAANAESGRSPEAGVLAAGPAKSVGASANDGEHPRHAAAGSTGAESHAAPGLAHAPGAPGQRDHRSVRQGFHAEPGLMVRPPGAWPGTQGTENPRG